MLESCEPSSFDFLLAEDDITCADAKSRHEAVTSALPMKKCMMLSWGEQLSQDCIECNDIEVQYIVANSFG